MENAALIAEVMKFTVIAAGQWLAPLLEGRSSRWPRLVQRATASAVAALLRPVLAGSVRAARPD